MARRFNGTVPEIPLRAARAGFRPAQWDNEEDVELWQVWLRSSDGEKSKRATWQDLDAIGVKPRRKVWG